MNPSPEQLEDWLAAHPPRNRQGRLLDVGAYRGAFSLACLQRALAGSADLFEPNPVNHDHLEKICQQHSGIELHKIALGSSPGLRDFFCNGDAATGSVLPYRDATDQVTAPTGRVPVLTLDQWWQERKQPPVALLKIDTQGYDLAVLQGAAALITDQQPWLVVEVIFVPLYVGQASPAALLTWAETAGYALAGLFNEHRTEAGMIAFADAVLVPRKAMPALSDVFPARQSTQALQEEIGQLREVCAERLGLIEYLHAEAEKRLRLIEELTRQLTPPANK